MAATETLALVTLGAFVAAFVVVVIKKSMKKMASLSAEVLQSGLITKEKKMEVWCSPD